MMGEHPAKGLARPATASISVGRWLLGVMAAVLLALPTMQRLVAQGTAAAADPPAVRCELPDAPIQIARPFQLRIRAQSPGPVLVKLAQPDQTSIGDFRIVSQSQSPTQPQSQSESSWTLVLQMETLRVGTLQIPPIAIDVPSAKGATRLTTRPLTVQVQSVVPQDFSPTEFRDIKPALAPADQPAIRRGSLLIWLGCLLVFSLVVAVGFWAFRRYRGSHAQIRRRWLADVDAIASQVDQGKLAMIDAHDEVCLRVRQWIDHAARSQGISVASAGTSSAGASSAGASSVGLVDRLGKQSWPRDVLDRLSTMLSRNDRIKFAGDRPSVDTLRGVFGEARAVIQDSPLGHPS